MDASQTRSALLYDSAAVAPRIPPRRLPPLTHPSQHTTVTGISRRPLADSANHRTSGHRAKSQRTPMAPDRSYVSISVLRQDGQRAMVSSSSRTGLCNRHNRPCRHGVPLDQSTRRHPLSLRNEVLQCVASGIILLAFFGTCKTPVPSVITSR